MVDIGSPVAVAADFREWLAANADELAPLRELQLDTDVRVDNLRQLQARLFDAGWAGVGWPEQYGGRGGTILHRAALYEELAQSGYPPRFVYEHLEVLFPSLVRFGHPDLMARLLPRMLRGEETWSQGFSEPGAGSDFAALRTRATQHGDRWIIDGHKIWTSWSRWAKRCLVVARTGTLESRHRELSAFIVDLEAPGVTVNDINQSNGSPELAEVFFDAVEVEADALVGEVNGGWAVAMYLLSCERGSFAWQRNTTLYKRLAEFAAGASEASDIERLGESAADLFAMKVRSWSTMRELAADGAPGPQSAVNKAFLADTEQYLYDTAERMHPTGYMWTTASRDEVLQEELLFSHAISIYGGTRQIQKITVFRQLVAGHTGSPTDDYLDATLAAVNDPTGPRQGLDALGYDHVLTDLDDADNRRAMCAVFEAAGRSAVTTPALGRLVGAVLGDGATLALSATPLGDGSLSVLADGSATDADAVVVRTAEGWQRIAADAVDWESGVHFLTPDRFAVGRVDLGEAEAVEGTGPQRAAMFGRLALAWEILGACDAMFDVAVEHAAQREQFGSTLDTFQAVQFMLADSHIARTALREVCVATRGCPADDAAVLTKLLAGRMGRRVGRETLQVLGAIGFTDEHPHHAWFHRVLTLDAVLGRPAALAREVGQRLVAGDVPVGLRVDQLPGAGR
ncbi:MAG: acyl-CoA dehydrogenase family protein [Acidimicrobiia bacterium]|nr:acyl-CoA dehydrogenase family protein [Acidimicrobiia bacterium]